MKVKSPIAILFKYLAGSLIVALAVFAVSHFCVGSYRISTEAMSEALQKGEYILVNKISLFNNPGRNQIVLFQTPPTDNNPEPLVLISRCIGMPGDTIRVTPRGYFVNNVQIPRSPNTLQQYHISASDLPAFGGTTSRLSIPKREQTGSPEGMIVELTDFEVYKLREELADSIPLSLQKQDFNEYILIVPQKNQAYDLNRSSIPLLKDAILKESKDQVEFIGDKVLIAGKETSYFFFNQDYYWLLSDNVEEAVDSRLLGFIPTSQIIGSAFFCWYSPHTNRSLKPVK